MNTNNTYSVYVHKVNTADKGPMWYVGVTNDVKTRWAGKGYRYTHRCSLHQYIEKYGWDNIEHRIVADGLDRDTAYRLEDCLILMYRSADCCINKQRSGFIVVGDKKSYMKQYMKQYIKDHKEELQLNKKLQYQSNKDAILEKRKSYYNENREKIKEKHKQYYQENKESLKEKAREYRKNKKNKIKNDDSSIST